MSRDVRYPDRPYLSSQALNFYLLQAYDFTLNVIRIIHLHSVCLHPDFDPSGLSNTIKIRYKGLVGGTVNCLLKCVVNRLIDHDQWILVVNHKVGTRSLLLNHLQIPLRDHWDESFHSSSVSGCRNTEKLLNEVLIEK